MSERGPWTGFERSAEARPSAGVIVTWPGLLALLVAASLIGGVIAAVATLSVSGRGGGGEIGRLLTAATTASPSPITPSPAAPFASPSASSPSAFGSPSSNPSGSASSAPSAGSSAASSASPSGGPSSSPAPGVTAVVPSSSSSTGATAPSQTGSKDPYAAVISAVARARPAVVTITSSTTVNNGPFQIQGTGIGSGLIFNSSGWILTNNHVIAGAIKLSVQLADGRTFAGKVVRADPTLDLAVVKISATGLPTARIGSSAGLAVGQLLIAIGNPLGTFAGSVTVGVLSAEDRAITVRDELTGQPRSLSGLLQTDTPINPGNSGGPLLDASGLVIGIDTATDTGGVGIAFAVPIDAAKSIMKLALQGAIGVTRPLNGSPLAA